MQNISCIIKSTIWFNAFCTSDNHVNTTHQNFVLFKIYKHPFTLFIFKWHVMKLVQINLVFFSIWWEGIPNSLRPKCVVHVPCTTCHAQKRSWLMMTLVEQVEDCRAGLITSLVTQNILNCTWKFYKVDFSYTKARNLRSTIRHIYANPSIF